MKIIIAGTQVLGKDASCDVGTFYRSNGDEEVGISKE